MSAPILPPFISADKNLRPGDISHQFNQQAVRADVVLGRPQDECRYHGICRFEEHGQPDHSFKGCQGQRVSAWLLHDAPGQCTLMIDRHQLPPAVEAYHFDRPSIECHRQVNLQKILPAAGSIQRGEYALEVTERYFIAKVSLA